MASLLASLDVWTPEEKKKLQRFTQTDLANWRHIHVGDVHASSISSP